MPDDADLYLVALAKTLVLSQRYLSERALANDLERLKIQTVALTNPGHGSTHQVQQCDNARRSYYLALH